ncbi:MAG: threonine/serine exporter family protein [Clostridia bacterium]|nr:threonine/serine exporter family protein [Clostridia bacterium]
MAKGKTAKTAPSGREASAPVISAAEKLERERINHEELLEFAVALANRLQSCGAETYRVEDTITRIIEAYGYKKVDVFVIPNCIIAGLETDEGDVETKIRRLKSSDTMLDGIEKYSALCRRICNERPSVKEARRLLDETDASVCRYGKFVYYLGAFLIGAGFGIFFGGGMLEMLSAGISCAATAAALSFTGRLNANAFFKSFVCSFILAFIANLCGAVGLCKNTDIATIGALMILVPGFLFTNSMRDIIYGDTMSGVNRLVQVLIIAAALVFGTSAAVTLSRQFFTVSPTLSPIDHPLYIQCLAGMIGTLGFGLFFNMHGKGIPFALIGSIISWFVCSICMRIGVSEPVSYLIAAAASSFYAEILARIRKFPATSYLLSALVPLIPGAGIYYTTEFIRLGMGADAWAKGVATAAIAGAVAVGVLLSSTMFRMWGVYMKSRLSKRR